MKLPLPSKRHATKSSRHKKGSAVVRSVKPKSNRTAEALTQEKYSERTVFPVVAVGASAGGLESFSQLLSALPIDTGMAFVFLQHLDPKRSSMLVELLSKVTKMPVEEVRQGTYPQPDHVYVLPPNRDLSLSQGVFRLTPRTEVHGQHLPIDLFMRSLAQERKNRAIGVVLSGTASDGTLGLAAIKVEGGITLAQDEKSAKFDAMPLSAIASGVVDFILPPEEIAKELGHISRHPYVNHVKATKTASTLLVDAASLDKIFSLLRKSSGVDFSNYRPTTIQRRIQRRMALHKIEQVREYARYLQENVSELEKLYQDLLIPVTSFFRDPKAFEALKTTAFPAIVANRSAAAQAIRIWAPGCSTGEEVYSLVITLLEFLGERGSGTPIQVFGTDLNEQNIEKARAALYPDAIAQDVSPERLQRFFIREEKSYRINKTIRDMCVFARHNLFADPPFSHMDLVSCRNVLIYMEPVLQKRIIPLLHYALNPGGFLFLGASEGTSGFPKLFANIDKQHKIFSRKAVPTPLHYDFVSSHYPGQPLTVQPGTSPERQKHAPEGSLNVEKEADRIVLASYTPPGVIVDGNMDVVQFRGRTGPYLEPAPGKASLNLLKMARGALAVALRSAIKEVQKTGIPVRKQNVRIQHNGEAKAFSIEVVLLGGSLSDERFFLILFEDAIPPAQAEKPSHAKPGKAVEHEIAGLRQELASSHETLRSTIEDYEATKEEFQAVNEEIVSANEELQSTNEELGTSREELQSLNEELTTVNDQLQNRNSELGLLSNDLNNLLAAINIPVVMVGPDLRIRRSTPAAAKTLKVIPSDIGRPLTDIQPKIQIPDLQVLIERAMETVALQEREVQDREGHWWSLQVRPYRTMDNKIDGAVIVLLDIDALKARAEVLEKAKGFADDIIDAVREPLLVLDSDLKIAKANLSFCNHFKVVREEAEGKLFFQLGKGQWNVPQLRVLVEGILSLGRPFSDFEMEQDLPEIGRRSMVLNARQLAHVVSGSPQILLAIEDVTERKRAAEVFVSSEKMAASGRLAATLAHEIHNPLAAVVNIVYLLESMEGLDQTTRDYLKTAEEELARIVHISQGTLSLYRKDSTVQRIRVADKLERILTLFAPQIDSGKVSIRQRYTSQRAILAFPGEIRQVLINLISNALDAMRDGDRTIHLHVFDSTEWKSNRRGVRIVIADNGVGIPREQRQRLFEPFATTKDAKGTGLGLWVSQGIIAKYEGSIRLRSCVRPGRSGTCVSVFIPTEGAVKTAGVNG